jgi:hypothetical protein
MRPETHPSPHAGLPEDARAAIEASARAVYAEYTETIVEALNVCPFARGAREEGTSRVLVHLDPIGLGGELEANGALVDRLAGLLDDESAEVVQVIFPGVALDAVRWERWAKALTAALRSLRAGPAIWAVAAFHPELAWSDRTPSELVPLFRRSPQPTVQWLRLDALERVREGRPDGDVALPIDAAAARRLLSRASRRPIVEVVSENNARTAARLGTAALEERLTTLARRAAVEYVLACQSS